MQVVVGSLYNNEKPPEQVYVHTLPRLKPFVHVYHPFAGEVRVGQVNLNVMLVENELGLVTVVSDVLIGVDVV